MNFRKDLNTITIPYIIRPGDAYAGPVHEFEACKVVEDYLVKLMNAEGVCCEWSYLDYGVGCKRIDGVMTVTLVDHYGIPEVFTFLYEKENE